jgi:hypothetical protein
MNSSSIQHHCTKHIICLIVFDLSFVSIQPIVTDADKDVLDTHLDKTDYMEIDYNSVHITVNEQAAPSKPNRNSKRAFQILPNMKPDEVALILDDYQRTYATAERPRVVTQYQGENPSNPSMPSNHTCQTIDGREPTYPSRQELIQSCQTKPKNNKFFI